jgi:hypothetical protein
MMPVPEFGIGPASVPLTRVELVLAGFPIRAVSFGGFLSIFRIVPPLLTLTRVDLISVSFPVRAGAFYDFLAISRILRISLLLPNGLEGSHRCIPPRVQSVKIVARSTALPQLQSFPGLPLLRGAPLPAKEPEACRMAVDVAVAAEGSKAQERQRRGPNQRPAHASDEVSDRCGG